jgi:hypothetical protein
MALKALLIVAVLALAACDQNPVEPAGYYKNAAGVRVFTFELKGSPTEREIREHARNLPYTAGRMTAAYYYVAGSKIPRDGVTLARSVFEVNEVLYEMPGLSPWRYAYMRSLDGSAEFVDCSVQTGHSLCRK